MTWFEIPFNDTLQCLAKVEKTFYHIQDIGLLSKVQLLILTLDWFWIYLGSYVVLILFAGMMSGLTLAILSLDLTSLKVLQMAGSESDKKYALHIMPLASRKYLVLVSLVLANSLAVEAMPLLLDRISTPYIAIGVSVTGVLLFGEVIPQAICGRYGLIIGYYFSWLVWTLIAVLFVLAWPLSKLLEFLLGTNNGTFYRRAELKALVDIHGPPKPSKTRAPKKRVEIVPNDIPSIKLSPPADIEEAQSITAERLSVDEVLVIKGALELATKQAKDAMIELHNVFMLSDEDHIDGHKLQQILDEGHSRIPVFKINDRQQIQGVLLTKRLITADPSKTTLVKEFIQDTRYFYPPYYVDSSTSLYLLLNTFQEGKSTHIAFVTEKEIEGPPKIVGVITLEDVIEELLLEEIVDETDLIRDVNRRIQLARAQALRKMSIDPSTLKKPVQAAAQRRSLSIVPHRSCD